MLQRQRKSRNKRNKKPQNTRKHQTAKRLLLPNLQTTMHQKPPNIIQPHNIRGKNMNKHGHKKAYSKTKAQQAYWEKQAKKLETKAQRTWNKDRPALEKQAKQYEKRAECFKRIKEWHKLQTKKKVKK